MFQSLWLLQLYYFAPQMALQQHVNRVISMAEQNVGTVLNRNEESLTKTNEITPGLSGAQIKSNSIEFES